MVPQAHRALRNKADLWPTLVTTTVIAMVAPPLRRRDALVRVRTPVTAGTNLIAILMRQRTLDRVRLPETRFVRAGAGDRAKTARRHFIAGKSEPTQRSVHDGLSHRPHRNSERRGDGGRMPRHFAERQRRGRAPALTAERRVDRQPDATDRVRALGEKGGGGRPIIGARTDRSAFATARWWVGVLERLRLGGEVVRGTFRCRAYREWPNSRVADPTSGCRRKWTRFGPARCADTTQSSSPIVRSG